MRNSMPNNIASILRTTIGIGFGLALLSSPAFAERLILQDADYHVYRVDETCDRVVEVAIATPRPSIFADGSDALKSLVTATRAIVSYECPENQGLRLRGYDNETREQLFAGRATARNNWEIITRYRAPRVASSAEADNTSGYQVAELTIGMSLAEVKERLENEYGRDGVRVQRSQPARLVAGNPECPFLSGRRAGDEFPVGARCLRVNFVDAREPTLDRLLLVQAVPGDQVSAGIKALQDRYGRPEFQRRRDADRRERQAGYGGVLQLGWGGEVDREVQRRTPGPLHQLNSELATTGRSTLLVLRLVAPSKEPVQQESEGGFGF